MNIEFEAERLSWLTGKSYNRCLDDLYEDQMIEQIRYEKEARAQYEAELHEQYEADMSKGEEGGEK